MHRLLHKTLLSNQSEADSARNYVSPPATSSEEDDNDNYRGKILNDSSESDLEDDEARNESQSPGPPQRNSLESTTSKAQTLVGDAFDKISLANTLTPTISVNSIRTGNQEFMDQRYGNFQQRKTMPINTLLFKSGVSVYGSYQDARTAADQSNLSNTISKKNKQRERNFGQMEEEIEKIWPSLFAYSPSTMTFSKKKSPYMIIQKFKTDGTKELYCTVYQQVIDQDHLKYVLELNQPNRDYPTLTENEQIIMVTNGAKRITDTIYRGIQMRWYGTTGLSSTFGSGFFELRFLDSNNQTPINNTNMSARNNSESEDTRLPLSPTVSNSSMSSSASDFYLESSQPPSHIADVSVSSSQVIEVSATLSDNNGHQNNLLNTMVIARRPPVAVYYNISAKSLLTKKMRCVGEFSVWEPGYEIADVITTMGLVLRKQEQRKNNEATHSVKYYK
ncbi:hypothetical protein NADFUDRAFT_80035 [Nadsonia fulvescens var. elongata DSM 6958]|uniref:Uncharacterized protein n=1 Tax=Nadsonia fulvescens var. elongata DSM 6958 TaxID=857566 RepID=A0A1E3PEN0_9ASCO|nr:hypothetical protein NADFUDRAFT_80035 [Nadsonia fulvescens var. elongata DSM 6958]